MILQQAPARCSASWAAAQERLAETEGDRGRPAGGAGHRHADGGRPRSARVTIDPKVVDPEDVDTLQDLVVRRALADGGRARRRSCRSRRWARSRVGLGQMAGGPGAARPRRLSSHGLSNSEGCRPRCSKVPSRNLIDELGTLPGIGPKEGAQRIAFQPAGGRSGGRHPDGRRCCSGSSRACCFCEVCGNVSEKTPLPVTARTPAATATLVCVGRGAERTCSRWSAPASSEAATTCLGGALGPVGPAWAPTS